MCTKEKIGSTGLLLVQNLTFDKALTSALVSINSPLK